MFREEYQMKELPELALFRPRYPYGEIAVIVGSQASEGLAGFCGQEGLNISDMGGCTVLSTNQPQTDRSGTTYVFSGVSRWRDKLIVGDNDIKAHDIAVAELRESIGEFELLTFNGDKLELGTDYFGMCQWYYHKSDDGVFAAATSYHLLLLTLKAVGTKLRLDAKKVAAGMAFFGFTCESSFTRHMDVEHCYELPLDQRIVIYPGSEPIFENTSLYEEARNPAPYTEEAYGNYMHQVKDDVVANVRAALEHPAFEYALCDLTGGLDSRMVLAAATNLPQALTEKIRTNTYVSATDDFEVANTIVNAFGLNWDDIPREKSQDGIGLCGEVLCQAPQSPNLGTYYILRITPEFFENKGTIHMTGGFGALYHQVYSWADYSGHSSKMLEQFCRVVDVPHSVKARQYFLEYLTGSITPLPGETVKEKLESFYIHYRNRHHFKTKYIQQSLRWMPLQSKAAFQCRSMLMRDGLGERFEFDMISLLNPRLAGFPYEKSKEGRYSRHRNAEAVLDHDIGKWQETVQESIFLPDEETMRRLQKATQKWYKDEHMLLSALKAFLDHSSEFEELGLPLYRYFVSDRHMKTFDADLHAKAMRINRLLSAYWQIKLVGGI
ncbi:MAG: hypothetical protein FWH32_00105 [Clostridiales bacterium]|nr:hypothetical protein [Clostridiales bacterium]